MLITDIIEFDKKRKKIFIDEEFAFVLYNGELNIYGIKEQTEIPENVYREIIDVVLTKRAKLRAANLLAKREYTENQIRNKLKEGGYPPICIETAISCMKTYHYLDDERYAASYLASRLEKKSKRQLSMELLNRGIEKEMVQTMLEEADQDGETQVRAVRALLKKKKFSNQTSTYEERQKISAYLYRKGFSTDIIQNEVNSCQFDGEES